MTKSRLTISIDKTINRRLQTTAKQIDRSVSYVCNQALTTYLSGSPGDSSAASTIGLPSKKTSLSLFSGAGGLDIGVEQAGFTPLACIEIDKNCCDTLLHNQPNFHGAAKIINSDVRKVDVLELMEELSLSPGSLDLLCGGPPCQTFSQIGKQDALEDDRGLLLFEMVRFAKFLRPKSILIENVKGLIGAKDLKGRKGGVLELLKSELSDLGYDVYVSVLNSADYGVPQLRKRTIIVAVRKGQSYTFPAPTHCPPISDVSGCTKYLTVGDAISHLSAPSGREFKERPDNHVDVTPTGDIHRISYVKEGSYLAAASAPKSVKCGLMAKDTTKFLRVARNRQANTLRCGEIFYHPTDDRYLTPREYMCIHGYPSAYQLRGPIRSRSGAVRDLDQHRQVANSVPPPLSKIIAQSIRLALSKGVDSIARPQVALLATG